MPEPPPKNSITFDCLLELGMRMVITQIRGHVVRVMNDREYRVDDFGYYRGNVDSARRFVDKLEEKKL